MAIRVMLFFALSLVAVRDARTQTAAVVLDPDRQTKEIERRKTQQADIEKAATEAEKRQVPGGAGEVTYDDVLAHPDDIELNYRYATGQVAKGNLRTASATLERILMIRSDLPKVRLFYAIVLFRLDNLDDAERELTELKREQMPESLRAELNDYIIQIRNRRRKTKFKALVGAGFDFNDNQNSAPATGRRLFLDTPIILDSNSTRRTDTAKTMLANLGFSHDLGYQEGHQLFGSLSYYRAEQTQIRTINLQNYGANIGGVYKSPWVDITPTADFSHLLLAQTTYLRSRQFGLRLDCKLGLILSAHLAGSHTRAEYNRTEVVPTGDQRTGDKVEGEGGLTLALTQNQKLSIAFNHSETSAVERFNAFRREAPTLSHSWLLGKGQFLLTSVTANYDRYQRPETIVSSRPRHDNTYRARATYGTPLGFIHKLLGGFVFTLAYEYFHSFSNIESYGYTNNKISSMLTYRWEG